MSNKYKIGDIVTLKNLPVREKSYCTVVPNMRQFFGKTVTIRNYWKQPNNDDYFYSIEEDLNRYSYLESWFVDKIYSWEDIL